MKDPIEPILAKIETYCKRHRMTESRFGRTACGNGSAIPRLRKRKYSHTVLMRVLKQLESKPVSQ